MEDPSNGYEAIAEDFISRRTVSRVGASDVRRWARTLPEGGDVLELGCGHGIPISKVLMEEGLNLFVVDASPSLLAAFRTRFPAIPAECSAVERSSFFGKSFDGIVAWGLMFLLRPENQVDVLGRAASALRPAGKLLFTSPSQICQWTDNLTGKASTSLGAEEYVRRAGAAGLVLENEWEDEGQNHYYAFARAPIDALRSTDR